MVQRVEEGSEDGYYGKRLKQIRKENPFPVEENLDWGH